MLNENKYIYILNNLENAGYKAFLVGGCVRDMLMGRDMHDYDIATNALPEVVYEIFSSDKVIPTGIKHGTVTVLVEHEPFEITTFRIDGDYSDSRHPDEIHFTSDLFEDLARRDFTMNAIAMDKNGTIYDPFNGKKDIDNCIIRCVGDPEKRFTEDALRILRAVRFSSVLGFEIEERTTEAALKLKDRLDHISAERISAELIKLISGANSVDVMLKFRDIIGQIIPELIPSFDFDQHSHYHKYDVYEHTVRAVNAVPHGIEMEKELRLAMLLHDCGKPEMFRIDESGRGHFKGHAAVGAEKSKKILRRLKFDNKTINFVYEIISRHSDKINSDKQIKRIIKDIGLKGFLALIEAKKSDNHAKRKFVLSENIDFDKMSETARKLCEEGCCMKLAELNINGAEIAALGFKGKAIGDCLNALLDLVIDDVVPNDHDVLISRAKEMLK